MVRSGGWSDKLCDGEVVRLDRKFFLILSGGLCYGLFSRDIVRVKGGRWWDGRRNSKG